MSHKQYYLFKASFAVLALGSIGIVCGLAWPGSRTAAVSSGKHTASPALAPEFKQKLRVWVHRDQITPKVIHAWPGKAVISVENATRESVSLQIERVLPNRLLPLAAVSLSSDSKRLSREVVLAVGEYVLYETSRPTVTCLLIVEPRH